VVGDNTCLIIHNFDRNVRVFAYDGQDSTTAQTVTGVLGYTDPLTIRRFMLVIHQALHIPMQTHNLIGLMQLRGNGILINDEPKDMPLTPTDDHHCNSIPATKDTDALHIPLSIKGVVSYFPTWKPTAQEYDSCP
jgi:hypothetical protein